MNVAVIPARGGSKRIPMKNIREFCGKPIIAWPIDIAKKSDLFEHILVSTDDEEIAKKYNKSFSNGDKLIIPETHSSIEHAYHLYPLQIDFEKLSLTKAQFFKKM